MDHSKDCAAIFDLDGTLVDSHDAHFEAWSIVARELGHDLTAAQFRRQFGRTNPPIIRELLEWTAAPPPDDVRIAELAERKESLFRDRIAQSFPVMPGGPDLLEALRGSGWRLAVGSSAPPANVAASIAGLGAGGLFEVSITGDDVQHGKPDPEVFLLAAGRLGVDPVRCVVLEDAPAGVEAARRAGMACVGLASKGRTREELADADLVVESLESLSPGTLERLLGSK
jgi:HAD superfamily hydrolase (TIGR01509 family)